VLGLKGVPVFPGAKFMFEDDIQTDLVQKFLSEGKSAYLLPADVQWDDVASFYREQLKNLGWYEVLSVDSSDQNKLDGEYWVKGFAQVADGSQLQEGEASNQENVLGTEAGTTTESGQSTESSETVATGSTELDSIASITGEYGLRIYSKYNDIWYEKITVEQAKTGLADVVAQEKNLKMMLSLGSAEELPGTIPWKLSYPGSWTAVIEKSSLLDIEKVTFTSSETGGTVVIEPVDFANKEPLRDLGQRYVDQVNSYREQGTAFTVSSVEDVKIAGSDAVKINLSAGETLGYVCLVTNTKNKVVYAIATYSGEKGFWDYVLANIEAR
jgi:hypothetical protein